MNKNQRNSLKLYEEQAE